MISPLRNQTCKYILRYAGTVPKDVFCAWGLPGREIHPSPSSEDRTLGHSWQHGIPLPPFHINDRKGGTLHQINTEAVQSGNTSRQAWASKLLKIAFLNTCLI